MDSLRRMRGIILISILVVAIAIERVPGQEGRPGLKAAGAAPAPLARDLYEHFVGTARAMGTAVETGRFQAHMSLALVNDGPVTLLLDTAELRAA